MIGDKPITIFETTHTALPVARVSEALYRQLTDLTTSVDEAMAVVQILTTMVTLDNVYRSQREGK